MIRIKNPITTLIALNGSQSTRVYELSIRMGPVSQRLYKRTRQKLNKELTKKYFHYA